MYQTKCLKSHTHTQKNTTKHHKTIKKKSISLYKVSFLVPNKMFKITQKNYNKTPQKTEKTKSISLYKVHITIITIFTILKHKANKEEIKNDPSSAERGMDRVQQQITHKQT